MSARNQVSSMKSGILQPFLTKISRPHPLPARRRWGSGGTTVRA
jgi:hypothetical protein